MLVPRCDPDTRILWIFSLTISHHCQNYTLLLSGCVHQGNGVPRWICDGFMHTEEFLHSSYTLLKHINLNQKVYILIKGIIYNPVTCNYHPDTYTPIRNVIIGSENSVKFYPCRDTHTQAKCRDTHTLWLPRYSHLVAAEILSYPNCGRFEQEL